MTTVSHLVLRDLVHAALAKQPHPVSPAQVEDAVSRFWTGDSMNVRRALRELEERGLAIRHKGAGAPPQGGRAPDRWQAAG